MNKFLIVGLGNIGEEYNNTRHNIGFDVVDRFVKKHDAKFKLERLAEQSEVKIKGKICICIKPTTYMNLSGKAVQYWMNKEKIAIENILVIVDDLALPLEKVRLRAKGSSAGHNGLKNIEEVLGTNEYPKLRFGIGNIYPKGMQVPFVWGKWKEDEKKIVDLKIDKSVEIIEQFIFEGIERTMNKVNNITITL